MAGEIPERRKDDAERHHRKLKKPYRERYDLGKEKKTNTVIITTKWRENNMATKATKEKQIIIPALNLETATLHIVGDSPLIVHAWSDKAKRMMLEKQMKKAKAGREVRDPFREFIDSLYWLSEKPENVTVDNWGEIVKTARFGFPALAFKAAAVDAAYQQGIIDKKTTMRGAILVVEEMAEIKGSIPEIREDMCRIGMGTADLRYRGEFKNWETELTIRYNASAVSLEQIANAFNVGGFACGVGEWRPAKDGRNGCFHVE